MPDPIAIPISGGLLWRLINWLLQLKRSWRLSAQKKVQAHKRWREPFEDKLTELWHEKLRSDVVIRDMARVDVYPDFDKKKGISAWFRSGLLDTYHRGIIISLGWYGLVEQSPLPVPWYFRWLPFKKKADPDSPRREPKLWRLRGDTEGGGENAALVGYIRFDAIEEVIWGGDEYYPFPHIYCYFDAKQKMPYERIAFCREGQNPGGRKFYTELAEHDAVRKLSKRLKVQTVHL